MAKAELVKVDMSAKEKARVDKAKLEMLAKIKKQCIDLYDSCSRLEEIELTGSTSTNAVYAWWVKCWEHTMQTGYTQDVPRGKRVVRTLLRTIPATEVQKAMVNFFQHADDWTKRNGYPIEQFQKQFHSLRGPQRDDLAAELEGRGLFDG